MFDQGQCLWNVDDWIWTTDLWCWKQPLYQLSHNHCPSSRLFVWLPMYIALKVAESIFFKRSKISDQSDKNILKKSHLFQRQFVPLSFESARKVFSHRFLKVKDTFVLRTIQLFEDGIQCDQIGLFLKLWWQFFITSGQTIGQLWKMSLFKIKTAGGTFWAAFKKPLGYFSFQNLVTVMATSVKLFNDRPDEPSLL